MSTQQNKNRITILGTTAFNNVVASSSPFQTLDYKPQHCYSYTILTVYKGNDGEYVLGEGKPLYPATHFYEEALGIPVNDPGKADASCGLDIPSGYTYDNICNYIDIASAVGVYNIKQKTLERDGIANLLKYIYDFAFNFKTTDEDAYPVTALKAVINFQPTEEMLADPNFDEAEYILKVYQQKIADNATVIAGDPRYTFPAVFKLAAKYAIKSWCLKHIEPRLGYNWTASGCINNLSFFGRINDQTEDEGYEYDTIMALAHLSRDIFKHEFIKTEGSVFNDTTSSAFQKAFKDWGNKYVNNKKVNREILSYPKANAVAFAFGVEANSEGKALIAEEGASEPIYRKGILKWTKQKTTVLAAESGNGSIYLEPNAITAVYKYTGSSEKGAAGMAMSMCTLDESKPHLRCPYENIVSLYQEVNSESVASRIRSCKPFDLESFLVAFKSYLVKLPVEDKLETWMAPDVLDHHRPILDLIYSKTTRDDINNNLAGLSINIGGNGNLLNTGVAPAPSPAQITSASPTDASSPNGAVTAPAQAQFSVPSPSPSPSPSPAQMSSPSPNPSPNPSPAFNPNPAPAFNPNPTPSPTQMVAPSPAPNPSIPAPNPSIPAPNVGV